MLYFSVFIVPEKETSLVVEFIDEIVQPWKKYKGVAPKGAPKHMVNQVLQGSDGYEVITWELPLNYNFKGITQRIADEFDIVKEVKVIVYNGAGIKPETK